MKPLASAHVGEEDDSRVGAYQGWCTSFGWVSWFGEAAVHGTRLGAVMVGVSPGHGVPLR
jgi:hypothetical protein